MPLNSNNYYNPFTESFLRARMEGSTSTTNDTNIILEDVDLYFQPVPNPFVAGTFSAIMVIILIIGLYLHLKCFLMVRKEDSILKDVSTAYFVAQMIGVPTAIITICVTNFIHNFPQTASRLSCPLIWFTFYFSWNIVSFHSFISATMRYVFIVHAKKVNSYGKQKIKKIFDITSILIPFLLTIWKGMDGSELDAMSYINKCYGKHHNVFLVEISTAKVFTKSFCEIANFAGLVGIDKLTALAKQLFCIASTTTMLIMGSNISEGFIYFKLFRNMNR